MSNIALFDMDGTITPARKPIDKKMIKALEALSGYGDIGIVSGSDFRLISEQVVSQIKSKQLLSRITLYPCNGTQVYDYNYKLGQYTKDYSASIFSEIGKDNYFKLYDFLLKQERVVLDDNPDIVVSGNFIEDRGSVINFCIPGRLSEDKGRANFEYIDKTRRIRERVFSRLKTFFSMSDFDLDVSIGGRTSLDIYPRGWSKIYTLKHLVDYNKITFVGDSCDEGGNDRDLYRADSLIQNFLGLKTSGPEETIDLIKFKIIPIFELK